MGFDGWLWEAVGLNVLAQTASADAIAAIADGMPEEPAGPTSAGDSGNAASAGDPALSLDSFLLLEGDTIFFEFDDPPAMFAETPEAVTGDVRQPSGEESLADGLAADFFAPVADDLPGGATSDLVTAGLLADGNSDLFEPAFEFLPIDAPETGEDEFLAVAAMTGIEPSGDFMPPPDGPPDQLPEGDVILPPEEVEPTLPEGDVFFPDDAGPPDAFAFLLA